MNDLLRFPSDQPLRHRYFVPETYGHPAKIHLGLLQWCFKRYTSIGDTVTDPMAGSGSALLGALLGRNVVLRDVEPSFVAMCHANTAHLIQEAGLLADHLGQMDIQTGNARHLWGYTCDAIIFSPPYGCASSRNPNARKGVLTHAARKAASGVYSERWTELLANPNSAAVGAQLFYYGSHPDQIGHFRGSRYWEAMTDIYQQAHVSLCSGGYMVVVIKDHVRNGQRVNVAGDTISLCTSLGFSLYERHARQVYPLSLWQRRRKERGEPVVEDEDVLAFKRS